MKFATGSKIKPEKVVGLAAVLLLHCLGLYGLWSYRIIPPPAEALIVFANFVNPPAAEKHTEPAAPKPAVAAKPVPTRQVAPPRRTVPPRQAAPRQVAPVSQHLLVTAAPVTSPAESVAPPPPVVAAPRGPVAVSPPAMAAPANVSGSQSEGGSGSQPLHLSGDLSLSCSERTPPVYPALSVRRNEQGKTILLVELDESGRVVNVSIKKTSGFSRLDEAARAAVKTWRCAPAKRNGSAVRAVALQPFNFTLKGP